MHLHCQHDLTGFILISGGLQSVLAILLAIEGDINSARKRTASSFGSLASGDCSNRHSSPLAAKDRSINQ